MASERRGRSLWQVLGIYAAVSWVCLQAVDVMAQNIGLPSWVFTLTLGMLIAGLPVTAITAYLQGIGRRKESDSPTSTGLFTWKNLRNVAVAALAIWGIAVTGWMFQAERSGADAERNLVTSLEEIKRLTGEFRFPEAYAIAEQLDKQITDDSVREEIWAEVARELTLETDPPGATVFHRDYESTKADWKELGTTPLKVERFPMGLSRLRFELEGYVPRETAAMSGWIAAAGTYVLDTPESIPAGMVRVSGGTTRVLAPGLGQTEELELADYFMDIHEVTNRQYKDFIDAGGYSDTACWKEPFVRDGKTLSFEEAVAMFVDQTGRPGPSTWSIGSYPEGTDNLPVGGVSWYEAAAYACFAGKSLPTVYHWFIAADPFSSNHVVPKSNFSRKGVAPVGQYPGISRDGIHDMAGNHREWAANADGEARYNLGGGWNDPEYAFNDAVTSLAFDRNDQNGIRLASYPDDRNVAAASMPLQKENRDFRAMKPVSDEVFEVYRQMYEYDDAPLNAELIETLEGAGYVREQIEIDAAYNNERLTVMVFLPTASNASPPYQTVMFFPGSGDIYKTSYDELTLGRVEFIVKSGRALIYPVYKGTYDRNSGLKTYVPDTSNQYRDFMIAQSKDLGRAIDYVESRSDLNANRLAYIGFSWGSKLGPIMVAMEKRLKTAIFFVGGLSFEEAPPMADPFNFLPRVTIPTFMFNGRYDSFFPLETSVMPMYENLGASEANKKLTVTDANHFVAAYNLNQLISESLDWLDSHLGTVE